MRVLIADRFPPAQLEQLRALGLQVDYRPEVSARELAGAASGASVLVVRGRPVPAEVFESGGPLALVVRAGAGVDTIDVAAAGRRGVFVANCPGQNSMAVAELAFGLILALDRHLCEGARALSEGRWDKTRFSRARGLYGRTLAIAGLGAIGREVARRGLAFGMRLAGWSRSPDPALDEELGLERAGSLPELAEGADVLSLHLPLTDGTRGLVGAKVLAALPDGAILINTARAELVDAGALLAEARSGRLRVGLDVWAGEPKAGAAEFRPELAALPNVVGSHHVGASTEQAQEAIAREAVRVLSTFVREGRVPNCVNVARHAPAHCQLVVRHRDRVGVLANVLDSIRRAGVNAQEIENTLFSGGATACCTIRMSDHLPAEALAEIRARSDEVIFAEQVELGPGR